MSLPLTPHLIRHGEVHNPEKILYGRLPGYRLSEAGKAQAVAAGTMLRTKPLTALYASPMQRAQETAALIASVRGEPLTVQTDARLNEVFVPYQGRLLAEMEALNFDLYTGNQPPYERVIDVRRRMLDFVASMRRKHAGQDIAAVTHGDAVVLMFMFAKQQDENDIGRGKLEALGLPERYPATASISTVVYRTSDEHEIPEYRYLRPC